MSEQPEPITAAEYVKAWLQVPETLRFYVRRKNDDGASALVKVAEVNHYDGQLRLELCRGLTPAEARDFAKWLLKVYPEGDATADE